MPQTDQKKTVTIVARQQRGGENISAVLHLETSATWCALDARHGDLMEKFTPDALHRVDVCHWNGVFAWCEHDFIGGPHDDPE